MIGFDSFFLFFGSSLAPVSGSSDIALFLLMFEFADDRFSYLISWSCFSCTLLYSLTSLHWVKNRFSCWLCSLCSWEMGLKFITDTEMVFAPGRICGRNCLKVSFAR